MNKPHCFPPVILQILEFLSSLGLDSQCPNPIMIFPGIAVQPFDESPSTLHSCQSLPLLLQQLLVDCASQPGWPFRGIAPGTPPSLQLLTC